MLKGKTLISLLPQIHIFALPPRVFRCSCFIHDFDPHVKKLDARALKGTFFGYFLTKKGYKCCVPSFGKWYVTKDITFLEDDAYFSTNPPQGGNCDTYHEEYFQ